MILDGILSDRGKLLKEIDTRINAVADRMKRDAEIGALKVMRDAIEAKIADLEKQ